MSPINLQGKLAWLKILNLMIFCAKQDGKTPEQRLKVT